MTRLLRVMRRDKLHTQRVRGNQGYMNLEGCDWLRSIYNTAQEQSQDWGSQNWSRLSIRPSVHIKQSRQRRVVWPRASGKSNRDGQYQIEKAYI